MRVLPSVLIATAFLGIGFTAGRLTAPSAPTRSKNGPASVSTSTTRSPTAPTAVSGDPLTAEVAPADSPTSAPTDPLSALMVEYDGNAAKAWTEGLNLAQVQAALARIRVAPPGEGATRTAWFLLRRWADFDPEAAWKEASEFPGESSPGYFLGGVAGGVAMTDLPRAAEMAMRLGLGSARTNVLREIADEAGKLDLAGTIAFWNDHPEIPGIDSAIPAIVSRMAGRDLELAASLVGSIKNPNAQKQAAYSVANKMIETDPEAALSWAAELDNPAIYDHVQSQILLRQAKADPVGAMTTASQLADPEARRRAQSLVFNGWARQDFSSALRYALASSDDDAFSSYSNQLGYQLRDATDAELESALDQFPTGKRRDDFALSLSQTATYAAQYDRALNLINQVPDSSQRDNSITQLTKQWGSSNPVEAANWLNAQPKSTDRDLAVNGFVQSIANTSPEDAARWTTSIQMPEVRIPAIQNVAARWLKQNPAAAERWLSTQRDLTESHLNSIREAATSSGTTTFWPNVPRNP